MSARIDKIAGVLAILLAVISVCLWLFFLRPQSFYWYVGLIALILAWRGVRLLERTEEESRVLSNSRDPRAILARKSSDHA